MEAGRLICCKSCNETNAEVFADSEDFSCTVSCDKTQVDGRGRKVGKDGSGMFAACGWTGVSVTNGTVGQGGSGTRMDECEGS